LLVLALLAALLAGGAWWRLGDRGHRADSHRASAGRKVVLSISRSEPPRRTPPLLVGKPALRGHRLRLTARSAILVDARSGRVLWALRSHRKRPVASTTKIMTAHLALRRLRPRDLVTVDPKATRVPLVKEGLRPNERVRAWKLLYGLLLYSGNDDAVALAIAAAGSRPAFVAAMNREAKRLGLRDTHFSTPSGVLDSRNYSSAWDLAALTRVAMRNVRFRRIVRTRVAHVPWSAPTYAKVYLNKNLLLGTYPGANGVKTGYTSKSGHCLVASARRGKVELIAVVLHARDDYGDVRRLLDLGFRTASAG
jgi:D-alanyl-D-alanine carboxypeptidase